MTDILKRTSIAEEAADAIRRQIHNGAWRDFLPGEFTLARRLGVGRPTIRAALRLLQGEGWLSVSPGKRRCILRRESPSESLPSKTVYVLSPDPNDTLPRFSLFLLSELHGALHNAGCRLELSTNRRIISHQPRRTLQHQVMPFRADAWVLLRPSVDVQRWFQETKIPCVGVGAFPDEVLIPYVRTDYVAAVRHATRLLLERGHKRIALLLAGSNRRSHNPFETAFQETCRDNAPAGFVQPIVTSHDGSIPSFTSAMRALWRSRLPPDALIVTSPGEASLSMTYLMHTGVRLPEGLSLISLGHDPIVYPTVPSVAHYGVNWNLFARKLVRITLRLLHHGPLPPTETLVMPRFCDGETLRVRAG